jgi:hypothetical protein
LIAKNATGFRESILPIYYIDTPQLQDDFQKRTDYLAQKVAEHNYEDIRELRHRSIDSYEARQKINKLANVRGGNSRSGVMTVAFVCDAGQSVERVRQNVRVTY